MDISKVERYSVESFMDCRDLNTYWKFINDINFYMNSFILHTHE